MRIPDWSRYRGIVWIATMIFCILLAIEGHWRAVSATLLVYWLLRATVIPD